MSFVNVLTSIHKQCTRYFGLWLETESIIMPIAYRCKCRNIDELWRGPPTFRKQVVAPLLVTQVLLHLPTKSTTVYLQYLQIQKQLLPILWQYVKIEKSYTCVIGQAPLDQWMNGLQISGTYLPTFQRPNSSPLNRRISNSMKLVDVLVHIDNYNLTNFH